MKSSRRLDDIDQAKGLAILLVVIGHIVAVGTPIGNEWYGQLKLYIYQFHMPFFMFLSGLIMSYSYKRIDTINQYFCYIFNKISRLAPAFLLFGVVIFFGKVVMSKVMVVDGLPSDIWTELFYLLVIPSQSAGGSLWFIYVLLEMYIVLPLLLMLFGKNPLVLIFIGVLLHFLPGTDYFLINRFFEYFIFFVIGVVVVWDYNRYLDIIDKYCYYIILIFLSSFILLEFMEAQDSKTIIGMLSIFALHSFIRKQFFLTKFWRLLGLYTFSIYLMNTIFIGFAKGLILMFYSWHGSNFIIIAPVLLTIGIFGPIFIKRYFIKRVPYIDKITN